MLRTRDRPRRDRQVLQGYDTKILETDRKLWRLTDEARDFGLEPLFRTTEPENLSATLAGQGGSAATWLSHFEEFLSGYGWRTEGIADVNLPSWVEDPTSPLGTIKTFLAKGEEHDFAACREAAVEEREAAVDAARSRLTAEEQTAFDQALALCRHANFAWWNEEHDFYIDLRATIPLRQALLAIGETLGCDRRDDTLFLFWPELMRILSGSARHPEFRALIDERRAYFDHWAARRPSMPKVLGTTPDEVRDPILVEIFGLHHQYLSAVRSNDDESSILVGVAASAGMARGRARVLHSALDLHRVAPGEILVCEATSPNWTPAFAKISGCVCDGGGTLTHASIVSREYRVPCVVGVGRATSVIKDGDELEVNGTKGIVTVFRARQ